MKSVIIGVDPHKLSATIEVVDHHERLLGSGRFATDKAGYAAMRRYVKAWPRPGLGGRGRQRCRPSAGAAAGRGRRAGGRCAGQARRPGPAVRHRPQPQDRRPGRALDRGRRGPHPRACGCWPPTVSSRRCGCSTDRRDELAHQRVQTVNRLQRLLSRADPRPAQAGPVRPAGQGDARHRAAPRHRREDPPPDGRRGARRPGRGRREAEEDQGRAQGRGHRPRLAR